MARSRAREAEASQQIQPTEGHLSDHPTEDGDEANGNVPPFFNTTFSTHRISPLYIGGKELDQARLDRLAHKLRDTLVGDVVRGIQIGLEATDTPMGQVGPLKAVNFRWFKAAELLGNEEVLKGSAAGDALVGLPEQQKRGLWIELRHENAAYVALLLPGYSNSPEGISKGKIPLWTMQPGFQHDHPLDPSQFLHMPLLLLRMPQPLKLVVGEWLSTTFDCRVSRLSLGTRTLASVLEHWLETVGMPSNSSDLILTLAFNAPVVERDVNLEEDEHVESGLKTMEVNISPADVRKFMRAGAVSHPKEAQKTRSLWEKDERERRRLAGANVDDGWGWRRDTGKPEQPFTEALAQYLNHHMALNLFHPSVRILQVSCGGFVVAQSRLKVVRRGGVTDELSSAAWMFVMQLGDRIRGDEIQR